MPMPELDPSRFFVAVLADPTHKLPLPGRAHPFSADGEMIDSEAPLFAHLLADGSLKRKPADAPAAEKAQAKADAATDAPKPASTGAPAAGAPTA